MTNEPDIKSHFVLNYKDSKNYKDILPKMRFPSLVLKVQDVGPPRLIVGRTLSLSVLTNMMGTGIFMVGLAATTSWLRTTISTNN